jgi:hypothetical protein
MPTLAQLMPPLKHLQQQWQHRVAACSGGAVAAARGNNIFTETYCFSLQGEKGAEKNQKPYQYATNNTATVAVAATAAPRQAAMLTLPPLLPVLKHSQQQWQHSILTCGLQQGSGSSSQCNNILAQPQPWLLLLPHRRPPSQFCHHCCNCLSSGSGGSGSGSGSGSCSGRDRHQ